jgi:KDO2-lipid IV(A) lauroyltransferase
MRALDLGSRAVARLPHPLLHRGAQAVGAGLTLVQRERRTLVRANLARVCSYLDANGMGSPAARRAARDPRALDRLVRRAFGHYVRAYLDTALAHRYTPELVDRRLTLEDPEALERMLSAIEDPASHGLILIALHFGSIELAGMWINNRAGLPMTVPMETIPDAALQTYLERGRRMAGLRLVPAENAARELQGALRRREGVAIVADRPLDKPGRLIPLFGVPAPLPAGAALLASESGATVMVAAARRDGWQRYRGRVAPITIPTSGTRRERVAAIMAAQVGAFEGLIADAPEQWWTIFFPIWPDIPGGRRP